MAVVFIGAREAVNKLARANDKAKQQLEQSLMTLVEATRSHNNVVAGLTAIGGDQTTALEAVTTQLATATEMYVTASNAAEQVRLDAEQKTRDNHLKATISPAAKVKWFEVNKESREKCIKAVHRWIVAFYIENTGMTICDPPSSKEEDERSQKLRKKLSSEKPEFRFGLVLDHCADKICGVLHDVGCVIPAFHPPSGKLTVEFVGKSTCEERKKRHRSTSPEAKSVTKVTKTDVLVLSSDEEDDDLEEVTGSPAGTKSGKLEGLSLEAAFEAAK